jgi:hypothetical protein
LNFHLSSFLVYTERSPWLEDSRQFFVLIR